MGDVEDNPVWILELALKILLLRIVAEIEKEATTRRFDPLLSGRQIIDLEAEMMSADEVLRVLKARAPLTKSSSAVQG